VIEKANEFIQKNITIWHAAIILVVFLGTIGTKDRLTHLGVSIAVAIIPIVSIYFLLKSKRFNFFINGVVKWHQTAMILFVVYLGSWLPDIDWEFGIHRFSGTHSILPFLIIYFYLLKRKSNLFERQLLVFFGFGLAGHLMLDMMPGGNIVKIPAYLELPFLIINSFCLIIWSTGIYRNQYNLLGFVSAIKSFLKK